MRKGLEWNHLKGILAEALKISNEEHYTDVGTNTDYAASKTDVSALSTRTATTRPILVAGIHSPADDVIDRLAHHQTLGHTRLDVEDSTRLPEQSHKYGVLLVVLANPGYISHTRLKPLWPSEMRDRAVNAPNLP